MQVIPEIPQFFTKSINDSSVPSLSFISLGIRKFFKFCFGLARKQTEGLFAIFSADCISVV